MRTFRRQCLAKKVDARTSRPQRIGAYFQECGMEAKDWRPRHASQDILHQGSCLRVANEDRVIFNGDQLGYSVMNGKLIC